MASQYFQEVVGRALIDPTFRTALLADPRAACEAAGLVLDPEEYAAIEAVDRTALEDAAGEIQGMGGLAG